MPFLGLGLHVFIALFCAIHAVRTGQPLYWLIILFSFPLLGSLVYFLVIYLPNSRLERGAVQVVSAAAKALDPGKAVRVAQAEFEATPTAHNQMKLAAALLEAGAAEEAAQHYVAALKGPFAADPDIRFGAAKSLVECRQFEQALLHLEALVSACPGHRSEAVALLLARTHAGLGRGAEARATFERAVEQYGTFEAYAEYAIWAFSTGDAALAARLQTQIDAITGRWNKMNRELNDVPLRRLKAAQQAAARN
jgi:hypothetical protein